MRDPGARAVALAIALASTAALADERFDHRGAVGLLIGGGLELKESLTLAQERESGLRFPAELGGTWAVDYDGNEVVAIARASFGGPRLDSSLVAGYRGYFGRERLKTFFDLGGALHFTPAFFVGPRLGFGVQYELSPVVGVYAAAAAQLGFGNGIRFSVESTAGLQLRSYLLE